MVAGVVLAKFGEQSSPNKMCAQCTLKIKQLKNFRSSFNKLIAHYANGFAVYLQNDQEQANFLSSKFRTETNLNLEMVISPSDSPIQSLIQHCLTLLDKWWSHWVALVLKSAEERKRVSLRGKKRLINIWYTGSSRKLFKIPSGGATLCDKQSFPWLRCNFHRR